MPMNNEKTSDLYPVIGRRFLEKIRNSCLTPTFLWDKVIDYQKFEGASYSRLKRGFLRLAWFWPKLSDAESWRDGGVGKRRDPEHFHRIGKDGEVLMREVLERVADHSAPVLDFGCNCGRYLDFLARNGYTNLHGVDISQAAFNHMRLVFPETSTTFKLTRATFQEFLQNAGNLAYEAVYSHGATVELVPATFPLVEHLCRVTKNHIILAISENGHGYPRFWEMEFERQGFLLTKLLRPIFPGISLSLLVFQRYREG